MEQHSNWFSETRTFYRQLPLHPLSAQAQALWHYLMYRLNEAYWSHPLYIHLGEMAAVLGISVTAVKRARKELSDVGLLQHEYRSGNQAGGYSLMSSVCPGSYVCQEYTTKATELRGDVIFLDRRRLREL